MADLDAVISGAMTEALGGGDEGAGDAGGADDSASADTGSGSEAAASADAAGDASPAAAVEGTTQPPEAQPTELDKELEALGIKNVAGKDNRIPHSRVVKIVSNAKEKWAASVKAEHEAALKAEAAKYTEAEQRLNQYRLAEQLAESDPERYVTMLAALNPAYKRFLQAQAQDAPAPAKVAEQPPQPDATFPDGTKGYSPEQHQKLLDWYAAKAEERAVKRVEAEYNKRFGPIEQSFQAQQAYQANIPKVRAAIEQAKTTWGEHFTKHEQEILKYLQDNPSVGFEAGVAKVLIPKLQADRTSMRTELLKELEARPKAAAPAAPASTKTSGESDKPKTIEAVIRESLAAVR